MTQKQKIIFCGDVEGKFNALFRKVESITKKAGPFDLLLCVGNFFGVNNKEFDAYKLKIKKVPIPTYVLGPNKEEHARWYPDEGSELCPNVHFLGKRGLYVNAAGLKIAYISGIAENEKDCGGYTYSTNDAVALRDLCKTGDANFRGIDILITSQWPYNVTAHDEQHKPSTPIMKYSQLAAWLNLQLKPRYHISGLEGIYYERPPYRSTGGADNDPSLEIVTRFIALGRVDNGKDKWLYALNLAPLDKMSIKELVQQTTDEGLCPFNMEDLECSLFNKKRKSADSSQYFFDTKSYEGEERNHKSKGKRPRIEFDQSKCWFCLASPSVEKHLVITVGDHVYLTVAKGGLVDEHFLICPMEHHQSIITLSEPAVAEVQKFKEALAKFYDSNGQVAVFFERNFKTSHMQVQAVPIPKGASHDVKDIFKDEANANGFKLEELGSESNISDIVETKTPYFSVELPSGDVLYTKINPSMNFPLNFGREVLASGPILNMESRSDWKNCVLGKDEEAKLVSKISKKFEPYDFT